MEFVISPRTREICIVEKCPQGCFSPTTSPSNSWHIPGILSDHTWGQAVHNTSWNQHASSASVQTWLNAFFHSELLSHASGTTTSPYCMMGCGSVVDWNVALKSSPRLFMLEVVPDVIPAVIPSISIVLPGVICESHYSLQGIIYAGSLHFTACLLSQGRIWNYDDQIHCGFAVEDHIASSLVGNEQAHHLATLNGWFAHLYIYSCQDK